MSAAIPALDPSQDHHSSFTPGEQALAVSNTPVATMVPITPPVPIPTSVITAPGENDSALVAASSSSTSTSTANTTTTTVTTTVSTNNTPTSTATATTSNASATATPVRRRTLADYVLGRTLGEGSYSTVVSAVDISNQLSYAIKVLDKNHIIREKKVKYVNIEKSALYKLEHQGVVKLYSTFQDRSSLYYVLELCKNGELLTFIKRLGSFDENCTRFYAAQILTAVEYVHSQGVIHRDLKPENILLDDRMYIKLTDFGTAKMLEPTEDGTESDRANSFVGTAEYVSPELLTEKAACKSSDLWALGCIIYQLLAGRPPFKGSNEYQTFQKIVKLEYSFPAGFPKVAMDLVSRLLVHDPNERLGANNTIDQLKQHPFFEGINWDTLWEQPAPRLMPYLPPTPAHNTEPLRSEHDTFLRDTNRGGETLMAVDPFRELGDSGSSIGNSEQNSVNDSDDVLQKSAVALEATKPPGTTAIAATSHSQGPLAIPTVVATAPTSTSQSLPAISDSTKDITHLAYTPNNDKATSAMDSISHNGPMTKSASASAAMSSSGKDSSTPNGHAKSKSSSGKSIFIALFSPGSKNSSKKFNRRSKYDQTNITPASSHIEKPRTGDISRENSSASLVVTASEISAYSKKTQLEQQAEFSPWQKSLLPTELIIFQTPVLKRKGLFSRSCILVLTDFPRLLYFDDSNHYFSQLFYSNTIDVYSSWYQQQRVIQWEQLEQQQQSSVQHLGGQDSASHRLYIHPSLSQESQNHHQQQLNAIHQNQSKNLNLKDLPTTGSGFLLARNGSSNQRHQQSRSEHIPIQSQAEEVIVAPTKSARPSAEHSPYQPQGILPTHHRQQSNGHNKIDVEKPLAVPGTTTAPSSVSTLSNSVSVAGNGLISGSKSNTTLASSVDGLNTSVSSDHVNGVASSKTSSVAPPVSPAIIKASKKQPKLRGEILFTASVVSEVKGKKCFFIHTTKKSYYFEEAREGEAKLWVRVLDRCMEEWFGERNGGTGEVLGGLRS
ncbi:pkb-activating kinase-like protein [Entomortierella beljakovae]|nr:pkb-activating kinase-like protein [Entomortierella beljakovae]